MEIATVGQKVRAICPGGGIIRLRLGIYTVDSVERNGNGAYYRLLGEKCWWHANRFVLCEEANHQPTTHSSVWTEP